VAALARRPLLARLRPGEVGRARPVRPEVPLRVPPADLLQRRTDQPGARAQAEERPVLGRW